MEGADGLSDSLWNYDFPVREDRTAQESTTGLVDLGYLGAAWRRGKRVWISFALIGLIIGAGVFLTMKPAYSATANVFLTNNSAVDASTAIQNASEIAQEPAVAKLALKNLGLPGGTLSYSVMVVDNQILAISLNAPTGADAVREVDAVASAFLTIRYQAEEALVAATLKGENTQLAQDQQALQTLDSQINQLNNEPTSNAQQQQLNNLKSQESLAGTVLSNLVQQQAGLKVAAADMRSGSSILSTTLPVSAQGKKVVLEYVGGPFFGFLILGLGVVAVRAVLSDRLYRRDDVAVALDAPVLMSVFSSASDRRSLGGRDKERRRESDLIRVAGCLRTCVPANVQGPASLAVVAVDDPDFAASALVRLAEWYSREGKRVALADLANGTLAKRFGVTEPGVHTVDTGVGHAVLMLPGSDEAVPIGPRRYGPIPGTVHAEVAATYSRCDVMLTLVVPDPAVGADHLRTWADHAVAVVTAGSASVARVQATGELIRHAGTRLTAGILLGADKRDESIGLVTA